MGRAAKAARVVEERKRRRVTLALAASVLLMIGTGGSGWAYLEQQQSDRRATVAKQVNEALGEARLHQRLADALGRIRGTFVLSYNDCRQVRRMYSGCRIHPLTTRYTIGTKSASSAARSGGAKELLITTRREPVRHR